MTIHLERKVAQEGAKYPYQRLSYDLPDGTIDKYSLDYFANVLQNFAVRSNGEFKYCITSDPISADDSINISTEIDFRKGEILYGEDFFKC